MSARGPLRLLCADICAAAPESVLREALRLALAGEGTYDTSDPPRLLARLIEDGFVGFRPTVAQIDKVRAAVETTSEQDPRLAAGDDECCDSRHGFTHPTAGFDFVQICALRAGHQGTHHNGLRGEESLTWPQEKTP